MDIEGQDTHCIASLHRLHRSERPPYASVENVTPDHIRLFESLGYFRFKAVDQGVLHTAAAAHSPELLGHSGPFGEAAPDALTGTHWQPSSTLRARLPLPGVNSVTGDAAWYDLHAALPRRKVHDYLERRRQRLGGAPAKPSLEHDGALGPVPTGGDGPPGADTAAAAAAAADQAADDQDSDAEADSVEPSNAPPLSLAPSPVGASDGRRAEGGTAADEAAAVGGLPPEPFPVDAAVNRSSPVIAADADGAASPEAGGDGTAVTTPAPKRDDHGGDGLLHAAATEPVVAEPPPRSPPATDGTATATPPPAAGMPPDDTPSGDAVAAVATPGAGAPSPAAPTAAAASSDQPPSPPAATADGAPPGSPSSGAAVAPPGGDAATANAAGAVANGSPPGYG